MVSLGFVVVLIGTGAIATAQPDPTALLTSATTLQQAGEHEAARVLLREAYTRTPTPRIAGQLAISELAVGRHRDAETHFTEALRSTDDWIVAHRTELVDGLARAAAELSTIDTSRIPAGTAIVLGSEVLGYAPAPIRCAPGALLLELRFPGGSVSASLQIAAGQTISLEPPELGAATAPPPTTVRASSTAIRFPDTFRERFAPRGPPRPHLQGTRWRAPAWAFDTELILATRAGIGMTSQHADGLSRSTLCGNRELVYEPRFSVASGIHHGFSLPVVLTARGFVSLEPYSACDTEPLPEDLTYAEVTRQSAGWILGFGAEASLRYTPRRLWYFGGGAAIGVGLFLQSSDELWRRRDDYRYDPAQDDRTTAELLWKVFVEVGATFGGEHEWNVGARLGGGEPALFSAELELVMPLGDL